MTQSTSTFCLLGVDVKMERGAPLYDRGLVKFLIHIPQECTRVKLRWSGLHSLKYI
jgi:hypothetical protein